MPTRINYIDFFSFHITTFKFLGYWKPDPEMQYKNFYHLYTFLCTIIWIVFLVSQYIFLFGSFDNFDELTDGAYVSVTLTIDLIKMLAIYRNMDLIKSLLQTLNQPMFQPKCDEHFALALSLKKYHKIMFYSCCYFGLQTYAFFSVTPFLRNDVVQLTPGWFPMDWRKHPYYEMVYVFQNVVIFWNTMLCLNLDTFTCGLMIQVWLQCDYLIVTLNSLEKFHVTDKVLYLDDEDIGEITDRSTFSRIMTENLIVCIEHYKGIKVLSKAIENIHYISVFILFVCGSMIICFVLFQLTVVEFGESKFFGHLSFLLCMLMEQSMYCWCGNEIIIKSEGIFATSYNTPWLDCDVKFQKLLLNFMTQTKKPIGLKAGGLFTMSIGVFVSVLKSSYSYFTLLRRMQDKKELTE